MRFGRRVGVLASTLIALQMVVPVPFASSARAQVFTEPAKPKQPVPTKKQPKSRPAKRSPTPTPRVAVKPPSATYDDPAPYCAAHRNDGRPGRSYIGPALPDWFQEAARLASPTPPTSQVTWRCQEGRVLVCSETATQSCGRASGGYVASAWRDVTAFAPSNRIGEVPGYFAGAWGSTIRGKGHFLKVTYIVAVQIEGGQFSEKVGVLGYYGGDLGGKLLEICRSDLVLRSVEGDRLSVEERTARTGPPAYKCPAQESVTMQLREGQLWLEWHKPGKNKVVMSGYLQRR